MELLEFIEQIVQLPGLSGNERAAADFYAHAMEPFCDEVYIDQMNNAIARIGSTGPRIMLTAHLDEIGLMVTEILRDGALRFTRVGGVDPRILPGSKVRVLTQNGPVLGVVGAKPPHLSTPQERKESIKLENMYIDIGYPHDEVVKRVRIGDQVALTGPLTRLANGQCAAKTMDDRACCATMFEAAKLLRGQTLPGTVFFAGATQEEVGCRGARVLTHALDPDVAIAIDVTHGPMQDCKPGETYPLDKVVTTIGPNIHPKLHARMMEVAKRNHIDIELSVCAYPTGTDASATQIARCGVPSLLIELPLKYMHTTVETMQEETLHETARLTALFIADLLANWGELKWN